MGIVSRTQLVPAAAMKNKKSEYSGLSREELLLRCIQDVITELVAAHKEGKDVNLNRCKTRLASKYGLETSPRLVDIIAAVPAQYKKVLVPKLRAKPVRTASGIAVVAVMCKPHRCPHINFTGNICVYCPGGPDSDFEYSTQAYTGYEPTSMRAIRARYDPFLQTRNRVDQLNSLGHNTDKVEFIVMGGTFMALDEVHRDYHRDKTGLLYEETFEFDVNIRLNTTGDWCAECVRRCCTRHKSWTHSEGG